MKLFRLSVVVVLFATLTTLLVMNWPAQSARGKSPSVPLSGNLTPEQTLAQNLALADARVQQYTVGRRSEVFGVRDVLADQYTEASAACQTADCRQVEIYNFDENTAVTAIVNIETQQVLDVLHQPGMQPGINKRLADLAVDIAINAPEVIDALGYKPEAANLSPVPGGMIGTSCDLGHLCAAPTIRQGNRFLWAVVDLTAGKLAGINWTDSDTDGSTVPFIPEGCPPPGTVNRDGWTMNYETTGTDSMRVYDIAYNGVTVATSIKLVEWHADYGSSGYTDATGCGGGGGGFPIYPYGNTQVLDLLDGNNDVIGFEVVQDFRMSSWGNSCNYRYEQRIQFFNDGRFRPASLAYGKGCGTNSLYRPLVRVDIAVNGDANDSFSYWDGAQWVTPINELYRTPYAGSNGPHAATIEGYSWRITDQNGSGYYLEPSNGQFGDNSEGDNPFVYAVQHHPSEGDTDLGIIGNCCLDDHQQGPHAYVNTESLAEQNIVVWYVPQMMTDATGPDYYCWTVAGEPTPETYPCWSGAMFVPLEQTAVALFSHNSPVEYGASVEFTNESSGSEPITYTWSFGDGTGSTETNPSHTYASSGSYTVVLTATNSFGSNVYSDTVEMLEPVAATAVFSHVGSPVAGDPVNFTNESTGTLPISYVWDFGDSSATVTDTNPIHTYTTAGQYVASLTATNAWGSSTYTATLNITAAPEAATAVFTQTGALVVGQTVFFTNSSTGTEPISYLWDFGDGGTSTDTNPSHQYTAAGVYTVTLTATNDYGSSTATITIEIQPIYLYLPAILQP